MKLTILHNIILFHIIRTSINFSAHFVDTNLSICAVCMLDII